MESDPHAQAPSERQAAILEGALRCFADRGYAATSIQDVCRASGASVGSIYHHFAGKDGIAAALYAEGLRRYQLGLLSVLEAAPRGEAGVRAAVAYHLRWVARNRTLASYLLGRGESEALHGARPRIDALNAAFARRSGEWLREMVERGELRDLDPALHVALTIGPAQQFARLWLREGVDTPVDDAIDVLADAAWMALAPPGRR